MFCIKDAATDVDKKAVLTHKLSIKVAPETQQKFIWQSIVTVYPLSLQ
jgi:hypothetical protein